LGLCNQHLGNLDDAIECYYRVIDLYPDNDQPWLTLIDLYIEKENYPKAVALLESASAEADFPEHFVARLCYCYFKLGLRNRMFNAIYKMAYIYPESLSTLLVTYPDMALDSEVVNTVNNMLKK
jgi:tetratricopeptide (TPR) repeat protein